MHTPILAGSSTSSMIAPRVSNRGAVADPCPACVFEDAHDFKTLSRFVRLVQGLDDFLDPLLLPRAHMGSGMEIEVGNPERVAALQLIDERLAGFFQDGEV